MLTYADEGSELPAAPDQAAEAAAAPSLEQKAKPTLQMQGIGDETWEAALQQCSEFGVAYKRAKEVEPNPVLVEGQRRDVLSSKTAFCVFSYRACGAFVYQISLGFDSESCIPIMTYRLLVTLVLRRRTTKLPFVFIGKVFAPILQHTWRHALVVERRRPCRRSPQDFYNP